MLSALVLSAALFSCSKEGFQEEGTQQPLLEASVPSSTTSLSSNVIYQEDFEGSSPLSSYVKTQFVAAHSFTVATNPVFGGAKSGRLELRTNDPMNNNGTRAEISFPTQSSQNRWYVFSAYFPSDGFAYDSQDELISQWHQTQHGYSSSISLRIKEDRFRLTVIPAKGATSEKIDLGAVPKNKWVTFAFHIKHSSSSDGLIELWMNGSKIVNRSGVNMYALSSDPDLETPKWKLGIYKSNWNGTQTSDVTKRVLYYDNIRLGNEKATLAEMTAGSTSSTSPTSPTEPTSPTSPTPSTSGSAISSFTLVDAATEKDALTITNGMTIGLSQLANTKLNIRANTASSSVKSIKFELSGAQSKTFIDNALPYALHGDNGAGNYYYGNWNPPAKGTYTLKATPYSGSNATGTAGTPYTITFTIA